MVLPLYWTSFRPRGSGGYMRKHKVGDDCKRCSFGITSPADPPSLRDSPLFKGAKEILSAAELSGADVFLFSPLSLKFQAKNDVKRCGIRRKVKRK